MAFIRWIAGFVIAIAIAGWAVFNRAPVEVAWSPFHDPVSVPLYLVALTALAAGFIFGGAVVWINSAPLRREKRRQNKELRTLEKEIGVLKKEQADVAPPVSDLFPVLSFKSKRT